MGVDNSWRVVEGREAEMESYGVDVRGFGVW